MMRMPGRGLIDAGGVAAELSFVDRVMLEPDLRSETPTLYLRRADGDENDESPTRDASSSFQ